MLAGFEELVLQCKTESSRLQISEAIKCYESGAYRAAIVMTHMAVCFDLIDKLKALAASGDLEAKAQLNSFESHKNQLDSGNGQAISSLLGFEKALLELFRDKFDFFGSNEHLDLVRLRDDRNRCAHPTFFKSEQPYNPSAEMARLHIRNALSLVLTQEPRQGKAAIEELSHAVLSQYFPDKVEDAAERLKSLGVSKGRDSLINAFVDELVFGIADKNHQFFGKVAAYVALDGLIELRRQIALPRTALNVNKVHKSSDSDAITAASVIVIRNKEIAALVDEGSKTSMRTWMVKYQDSVKASIVNVVKNGLKIDWLAPQAVTRINTLTADEIAKAKPDLPSEMLQHAAKLYCEAKNWDQANDLAQKVAIPFSGTFTEAHLDYIFDQAKNGSADLIGSHGFGELIRKSYDENPIGKDKLDELTEKYSLEFYRPS